MYWPTGTASRLSLSSTQTNPSIQASTTSPTSELKGTSSTKHSTPDAPIGLFATWTSHELTIWNPKPKIAITKLVRNHQSCFNFGHILDVKWKPDQFNLTILIWTVKSVLIVYNLVPLPKSSSVYKLPVDQSSPFLCTGPADRIPFPKLVLKLVGEIPTIDPSEKISCLELTPDQIILGISAPVPQIRSITWDSIHRFFSSSSSHQQLQSKPSDANYPHYTKWFLSDFEWLINPTNVRLVSITYSNEFNFYIFVTSDGRSYMVHNSIEEQVELTRWIGSCFHDPNDQPGRLCATGACAINFRFNLLALGLQNGIVIVYTIGDSAHLTTPSHLLDLDKHESQKDQTKQTSKSQEEAEPVVVNNCAWTSDGYALAVSCSNSLSVWSVFGRLQFSSRHSWPDQANTDDEIKFEDYFIKSCKSLFWGPGNFELFLLTTPPKSSPRYIADDQLFVLSFAKSAVATLHSPDNTKHAFLQLDDRVSVYRGIDCTDMSILNPESDVWQQVKIPADYISTNWPIEFSCISDDGLLLAVAGKRGFTHFNLVSGRWKLFESEDEEQAIHVSGGMQWFGSILVTGIDEGGLFSIRLFARENPLSLSQCLFEHALPHPIVLLSIYETSLLVYTADNTLYHFIIKDRALIECGSIGFEGVIGNPSRARGMSWLIPDSQHCYGEPENDLNYATIIFLIDGKIVLLRPSRSEVSQVRYDLQIMADRIEFYWTGRQFNPVVTGSNLMENSLWAWDGSQISVWLDALSNNNDPFLNPDEDHQIESNNQLVQNGLTIPLNFHPLSVLVDKGIIVGIEQQTVIKKSLKFSLFKIVTNTELFIHRVIKFYLSEGKMDAAIEFASNYSTLVYFGHSLEILLHTALEEDQDAESSSTKMRKNAEEKLGMTKSYAGSHKIYLKGDDNERSWSQPRLLESVIKLIDHFNKSLQVVVGCARKVDVKLWKKLFDLVGKPRELFEKSLHLGFLDVACSYLSILNHYYLDDCWVAFNHNHNHNSNNYDHLSYSVDVLLNDSIRLFNQAVKVNHWNLCKELMRFLFSLDGHGHVLKKVFKFQNQSF